MFKLSILGKPFAVSLDNALEGCIGECDTYNQTIKVNPSLPEATLQETLLHEVIHAVEEQLHLRMTERQVFALATGLYAVFKDNQEILGDFFFPSQK